MLLSSKFKFCHIFKVDPLSKKQRYLKSLEKIRISGYGAPIIFEKTSRKKSRFWRFLNWEVLNLLQVISIWKQVKNSKEGEKMRKKAIKAKFFHSLANTKIWSNSERSSHKNDWKVKILRHIYMSSISTFHPLL